MAISRDDGGWAGDDGGRRARSAGRQDVGQPDRRWAPRGEIDEKGSAQRSVGRKDAGRPDRRRQHRVDERTAVELLTGEAAGDMLRTALADRGIVRSWRVHAVNHRPAAGVSVGYSVVWDRFAGETRERARDARRREDTYLVASTARISPEQLCRAGVRTLCAGELAVHVWQFPSDPHLPALEIACDPERLSAYLDEQVEVELVGYRPTRRAVVRVRGRDRERYAKVIRPRALEAHVRRLTAFETSPVRVPRIERMDRAGLLLTSAIPGVPLSAAYERASAEDSTPSRLDATFNSISQTLDSLPLIGRALPRRPAWVERAEQYAGAVRAALPELGARAAAAATQIREHRANADLGPELPTHGDFYEANIFIDPAAGVVAGIVDVDSFGPGYRADDWGCLLGHLSVLPALNPKYAQLDPLAEHWFTRACAEADPVALATSAAGVVLSLVAGARQRGGEAWKQQALARMRVVERWLTRARAES